MRIVYNEKEFYKKTPKPFELGNTANHYSFLTIHAIYFFITESNFQIEKFQNYANNL